MATPSGGVTVPSLGDWAPVFLATGLLAGLAALAGLRVRGQARVVWLAAAAGGVYGVLNALTKATVDILSDRGIGRWPPGNPGRCWWPGCSARCSGRAPSPRGALSLSLPVIDTLAPITAVVIAVTVFGEQLASAPWQRGLQLAGGALAVARHRGAEPVLHRGRRDPVPPAPADENSEVRRSVVLESRDYAN